MNREIKFRGKTKLGDWLYGSLTNIVNHYQIVACTGAYMDVQEETIGQFTGLYDKNKVPIYEGDILKIKGEDYKYIVDFYNGCFVCVDKFDEHYEHGKLLGDVPNFFMEVLGNIYENSDLLGE